MPKFEPTHTNEIHAIPLLPTVCWFCGMHAVGLGAGERKKWRDDDVGKGDMRFLCEDCKPLIGKARAMAKGRLDVYELKALDGGVDAVGDFLDEKGLTDLALMDELDARMIVKAAWEGCARRLRQLIADDKSL